MTSSNLTTQPAYERVAHEPDIQPTNKIPRRPVAQGTHSTSDDGLLKSPTTPNVTETASLVSGKEEAKTYQLGKHGNKQRVPLRWWEKGVWPVALFRLVTLSIWGLVIMSFMVPVSMINPEISSIFEATCGPSGNFGLLPSMECADCEYTSGFGATNPLSPSGIFEITIGFGDFSFSKAKLIDVVWDIVTGRGGQALLAYITYHIYSKALVLIMERSSVSLEVFKAITIQGGVSIRAIFTLINDFRTNATTGAKLSICWMIIAGIYVLFFQTMSSAMTGYSARSSPYVQLPDGTQQPWTAFTTVIYIIHDAWRLGLTGDYIMTDPGYNCRKSDQAATSHPCLMLWATSECTFCSPYHSFFMLYHPRPEQPTNGTDFDKFGSTPTKRNRTFGNLPDWVESSIPISLQATMFNISAPTLNISSYVNMYWNYTGSSVGKVEEPGTWTILGGLYNGTMDSTYVQNKGLCSPERSYQWGFSGFLLLLTIVLTTIWAIGMWAVWVHAYYQSNLDLQGRNMGLYRAVMDIAKVVEGELDQSTDTDILSEQELHHEISDAGKRMLTISYKDLVAEKATTNRAITSPWTSTSRQWKRWWWIYSRKKRTRRTCLLLVAILLLIGIFVGVVLGIRRFGA